MIRYDRGQSLIEIILALAVAGAIITGITAAVLSSIKNTTFSKNQNLASSYAQEGLEVLRAIRDRSWADFVLLQAVNGPNLCLPENSTLLVPRSGPDCDGEGNVGIFIREVTVNNNSSDCTSGAGNTKVTLRVKWSDSICPPAIPQNFCHKVELISCFTNINVVPTP